MKYLVFIPFCILLCVFSAFAQIENKQREPTSLIELAKQPICGTRHIAQLETMVKDQPDNAGFQLQLTFCLERTRDTDFLKVLSVLVNLNPKFESYRLLNLYNLLADEEITKSETYLKSIFAALPNHWFPYAVRTKLKIYQKDYQGAFDSWLKAIELLPLTDDFSGQSNFEFSLSQITFDIHKLGQEKDALVFYETFFNTAYKRQQKLILRQKEASFDSAEYKKIQDALNAFGNLARSICLDWARFAVKSGNTQMENTVLEKMVAPEPRWSGYSIRSLYYKTNGNPKKAFADQVRSYEMRIESLNTEFKQGGAQARQLGLNDRISNLYSTIGDLYFRDTQYVKAISNYEKAKQFFNYQYILEGKTKQFSDYQFALEGKINAALKKLNVSEEKPAQTFNPNPENRP